MTSNTEIHDYSPSWLDTAAYIKGDGAKLVLWTQTSPFSEMMPSRHAGFSDM
jgi:hypothetical protein